MIRIIKNTLDECYIEASNRLRKPVDEVELTVIQKESRGFLGLFKKRAIIVIEGKDEYSDTQNSKASKPKSSENVANKVKASTQKSEPTKAKSTQKDRVPSKTKDFSDDEPISKTKTSNKISKAPSSKSKDKKSLKPISDNTSKIVKNIEEDDNSPMIAEIKSKLEELLSSLDFNLYVLEIKYLNEDNAIYVNIGGDSLALIIGNKGYRYKAIYHLISTWLMIRYNVFLRLEIAEFLQKQEDFLNKYIDKVCYSIEMNSYYETEIFDEVSIVILEDLLRKRFFEKTIIVKNSDEECKQYIILKDRR